MTDVNESAGAEVVPMEKAKKKTITRGKGKAKPSKAAKKVAKAKKVDHSGPCACQCGETAKGGGFVPGHDSRLAGAMKRIINGKPYEGERAQVLKVIKADHEALGTPHFQKLIEKVQKAS